MTRVVSFNVNGLRSRLHQLSAVVERLNPDVIGLQETKVTDVDFPLADVESLGYHVLYHGQKTHYGVALLTRKAPVWTQKGFPDDDADAQRRFVAVALPTGDGRELIVANGYFPQGESRDHPIKFPAKSKYYEDILKWTENHCKATDPVVIMGDMNISPTDLDIGIGAENARRWLKTGKCSFLPEERAWLERLSAWGLVDTYRRIHPTRDDKFSWFDYRSRGFEQEPKRGLRIDLILASQGIADRILNADIDYETRAMDKPSDHCPVWADLDL